MIRRVALLTAIAAVSTSCAAMGIGGGCDGTTIIAEFEQVSDLVEKANVQSRDVVIGSVDNIELDEWTARVTMCLKPGEEIPADARAVVRTTSLLGEKFVDLNSTTEGGPILQDGDVIPLALTGKSTDLEDVFERLATVIGAGNLEQINEFTRAQRNILEGKAGSLRQLLGDLREFTDILASRRTDISSALDNLDDVSTTVLADRKTLENFLASFGDSAEILSDQKEELRELLLALDDFSQVSIRLLENTEKGINKQFDKLRPILNTLVANSDNVVKALQSLATFNEWFPETMPGDYLQLDVCQAVPHEYNQGFTCPQNAKRDDPDLSPGAGNVEDPAVEQREDDSAVEYILRGPLRGDD